MPDALLYGLIVSAIVAVVVFVLIRRDRDEPRKRPAPAPKPRPGMATEFDFKEGIAISTGRTLRKVASPGTAIIDVQDEHGNTIVLDTIKVSPAPKGAMKVKGRPATFVIVPNGPVEFCQQEFTCEPGAAPFALPPHLNRVNAAQIKIFWSCNE